MENCISHITFSLAAVCDIFHHRLTYPDERTTFGWLLLLLIRQRIPAYFEASLIEFIMEANPLSAICQCVEFRYSATTFQKVVQLYQWRIYTGVPEGQWLPTESVAPVASKFI